MSSKEFDLFFDREIDGKKLDGILFDFSIFLLKKGKKVANCIKSCWKHRR
jgi:hypothetical protein